jgi:hypothetical protein
MFITTAFLYGHLKEEIYFEQLESCISPHDEFKVYSSLKSLYGLKQALHVWYAHFNIHLLNIIYIQCSSEQREAFEELVLELERELVLELEWELELLL